MGEVHPDCIPAIENQPIEAVGIPVIDLSPLNSLDPVPDSLARLVTEIGKSCKNWGCFQVINHGVPSQAREKIELASKQFFALSKDEKRKVSMSPDNLVGYSDKQITKDINDWKESFVCTKKDPTIIHASNDPDDQELRQLYNHWPQYPPQLREVCEEYAAEMQKLGCKLLELISLSLGLEKDRFNGLFDETTSFTRLNYYPVCSGPEFAFRIHTDAGALTILAQDDVGGLEAKRICDGVWVPVKPTPGAYIIIVGELIQIWSNDKYKSVEHRVKANTEKERFSIPFFVNPSHYIWIEPLEELINEQNKSMHKGYRWGKYYVTRKLQQFK